MIRSVVGGFGRSPVVEPPDTSVCEATLPSSTAVDRLLGGDMWAIPAVVMSTMLRGGLIAAGMYAAGFRGNDLVKGGLSGALGIEMFVVGYVWICRIKDAKEREAKAAKLAALHGFTMDDAPWEAAHRVANELGLRWAA
jgi:hypothetical protein